MWDAPPIGTRTALATRPELRDWHELNNHVSHANAPRRSVEGRLVATFTWPTPCTGTALMPHLGGAARFR